MAASLSERLRRLAVAVIFLMAVPGCVSSAPAALVNGDFSEGGAVPAGWELSKVAAAKGSVRVEGGVLSLAPNAANTPSDTPLGIGQALDATAFHGKRLVLSATTGATGGAAAVVGLAALAANGSVERTLLLRSDASGDAAAPQVARDTEPLPEDVKLLILFASVEGTSGAATFDDISVSADDRAAAATGAGSGAAFDLDAAAVGRPLPWAVFGANVEWIREGNGLWDTGRGAISPSIEGMAKAAGITLVRFPGGVWSDTYDWRRGVGPRADRTAMAHVPGQAERSVPDLGTDEIAGFARAIGAKLMITVNVASGTPEEAGAWAAYVRDQQGADIAPYWELGNELYMASDLSGGSMPPDAYAKKVRAFAAAIRRELPHARIAAIGLKNYGPYRFNAHDDWNDVVLRQAGDVIDVLAIHDAYAPLVVDTSPKVWTDVYRSMLAAPQLIAQNLRDTAAGIDRAQPTRAGHIGIAVTEWGPMFSVDPANPYFDHVKTLGSGVFAARTLDAFLSEPRVEAAAFFKLSDWLNMGWIGPTPDGGFRETPALLAFGLYRQTLGPTLLPLEETAGGSFFANARGFTGAVADAPTVGGVASRDGVGRLGLVLNNADLDTPQVVSVRIAHGAAAYSASARVLTGPAADANRGTSPIDVPGVPFAKPGTFDAAGWFRNSGPDTVAVHDLPVAVDGTTLTLTLPPVSVAAISLVPRS